MFNWVRESRLPSIIFDSDELGVLVMNLIKMSYNYDMLLDLISLSFLGLGLVKMD